MANTCENCKHKDDPSHTVRCRKCIELTKFEKSSRSRPSVKCEHCIHMIECYKSNIDLRNSCMKFINWED